MKTTIPAPRSPLALLVLLALAGALAACSPPPAGQAAEPRSISVRGEGEVRAVPDLVILSVQVSATAERLGEAQAEVDAIGGRVLQAANAAGVAEDDVKASRIQAAPEYEWQEGRRILRGQQVSRDFEITLRDAQRYGELVDALLAADITRLGSVRFDFSERGALQREAETLAALAAREQASHLAQTLGARLGPVLRIQADHHGAAPMLRMEAMAADSRAAAPLKVGPETVSSSLQVVFSLKD